jgi:hypothetical protein
MKLITSRSYLNVPEAFPSPRFSEYLCALAILDLENLLGIPFEMSNEFGINEMIHYPAPQWTAPGLICPLFTLKFTFNVVAFKLEIKRGKRLS